LVQKTKYKLSFTAASALIAETLVIAEEFEKYKDWKLVKDSLEKNNLMNKVKAGTFKREFSEIKKRLSLLTPDQMKLLINGSLDDAKAMILVSLIKLYEFLYDFIIEVLRYKYMLYDRNLTEIDYNKFFNSKSIEHVELELITEATAKKIKQVVFKLLEQVGLISTTKNGIILKPILSSEVVNSIIIDEPSYLNAFLLSNEEIKSLLKNLKND